MPRRNCEDDYHLEANADDNKSVQSVDRALSILEALSQAGQPLQLGELAQKVRLKPSTVHRLLSTLMKHDFVEQDAHSRYRLTMKLYYIGNSATYAANIKELAYPVMQELLERYNETVNLAILDRGEVVYIDQLESNHIVIVRMFARVGNRGPAYCTGSGKVLLAGLGKDELQRYFKNVALRGFTTDTITDPITLARELDKVRQDGYALDLGERDEGVRCVAAPIKNQEGSVIAALSVSGPSMRMTASFLTNELVPVVKELAAKISNKLGYPQTADVKR
ncbi:IclR family transcriptional regulator [Syntrophomonas palmitatica]|uniref:IclR family transcriptional regulator n=1 Tax=Syntrophomonas palmitatica TaxID=402877 RepID=UPI0006D266EC|nr:IclR family transcriptional regulator [Syntrophomonas palmitatica]